MWGLPLPTFLIWLLIFILFLCIIIAAMPRTRRWWRRKKQHIVIQKHNNIAEILRSQRGDTVLPQVDIPSASALSVPFNRPMADTTFVSISKTAHYEITYTVQFGWTQEAVVATAVRAELDNNQFQNIDGSQLQMRIAMASTQVMSHTFPAFLERGTKLSLLARASGDGSVFIPASDTSSLLTPTTLALLCVREV